MGRTPHGGVAERLGTGLQSRLHGFESRRHLASQLNTHLGAIGAAVARFPDTEEVTGSIPVSPTNKVESWFARAFLFNLSSMIRVAE